MKKKTVKIFTKPGCEKCELFKTQYLPRVKEIVKVKMFDMGTPDGLAEAVYYGVTLTPTLILTDEEDRVVGIWDVILEAMKDLERMNTPTDLFLGEKT